jgi:flagella basal body P-ring formation protein FlgA
MRRPHPLLSLCVATGMLACSFAAHADLVSIRASARLVAGERITLADIAEVDGTLARRFANTAITVARHEAFEITRAEIETALKSAGANVRALRFHGDRVVVRPLRADVRATPASPANIAPAAAIKVDATNRTPPLIDPAAHLNQPTPLGIISELMRNAFESEGDRLRLLISAEDLVRLTPEIGLRHEVAARSALRADSVSFEITTLDGDKAVSRRRVRVSPRVLTDVAVVTSTVRRGTQLTPAQFSQETRAIEPSLSVRAAVPERIDGSQLVRGIEGGAVIRSEDLTAIKAIRRNDRVIVRRDLGAIAIEIEAIALEDGAPGDIIMLERAGTPKSRGAKTDDTRSIRAEVVGDGLAVIRSTTS